MARTSQRHTSWHAATSIPLRFFGKHICRHPNGDITVSLERSYYYSILKHMDLDDNSNPTSTPSLRRPPAQQDSPLDPERHRIYRNNFWNAHLGISDASRPPARSERPRSTSVHPCTQQVREELVRQEGPALLDRLHERPPAQLAGDLLEALTRLSLRHLGRKPTRSIHSKAVSELWRWRADLEDTLRYQQFRNLPGPTRRQPNTAGQLPWTW